MVTLRFWVFHIVIKTFKKIYAVTLRFTKLIHCDLFAHKTLSNVNFKACKAVVRLFMRFIISNAINYNFFPQNINANSIICQPLIFFPPNPKIVELGFMFWGKKLKLIAFEMVSSINRRIAALKLRN